MPKLRAERINDKPGALRVTMCYSTTIFEDFLKSEPEAQKDILRRDMQQAALDVINSTDFTDVEIIDEQGGSNEATEAPSTEPDGAGGTGG